MPEATDAPTTTARPTTTAAPAKTQPPTTTAALTTTVDPRQAAADAYFAAVTPLNCYGQLFGLVGADVFGPDNLVYEEDWPAMQEKLLPAYTGQVDSRVQFINFLVHDWPVDVQADIDTLTAELSAEATWFDSASHAASFNDWLNLPLFPDQGGASTVIRAKLGLPSNINSTVQECVELGLIPG